MSTVNAPLKYLWTAYFEDGTSIEEPADDHYSKHDPEAEANPSAFRDLLDKEEESKLVMFVLNEVGGDTSVGVDLETGQFAINGVAFDAHSQQLDLSDKQLKIVFHREVQEHTSMNPVTWEEQGKVSHITRYFIGWQIVGEDTVQTVAVG